MPTAPNPTRVLVVKKPSSSKAGFYELLKSKDDFIICGQATDFNDAIDLARGLKPDLILLDWKIQKAEDFKGCKTLREIHPPVKIIVITGRQSEDSIFSALRTEADGYCMQESLTEKIYEAARTVSLGEFWLDSAIAKKVVKALVTTRAMNPLFSKFEMQTEAFDDKFEEKDDEAEAEELLTKRELEVLQLVAQGLSNQKIADQLSISAETVKSHLRHIMKKLVATDRTQAAVKAVKRGLI